MPLMLEIPRDFPKENILSPIKISQLIGEKRWDELEGVSICKDCYGSVTSRFGDNNWDCSPFYLGKFSDASKRGFSFKYLLENPGLLLQAKIIVYGWLYYSANKTRSSAKLATLTNKFNNHLKRVFIYLMQYEIDDITELNRESIWSGFVIFLKNNNYSRGTLEHTLCAVTGLGLLRDWLPFNLTLPEVDIKGLSRKLANPDKQEDKQTLAIPQRLANIIYGEAIKMVEEAWQYCDLLVQLEYKLQSNFEAAKFLVDQMIRNGKTRYHLNADGQFDKHLYAMKINKTLPESYAEIIHRQLLGTGILNPRTHDGKWYSKLIIQLQTACFICCGAFTGMRFSELYELKSNSFFTRELDGRTFSVVRGAHMKLIRGGKKYGEWLTSPIVEKAIALATALVANQSEKLRIQSSIQRLEGSFGKADTTFDISNCLWLTQRKRGSLPRVIQSKVWNQRVSLFAESAKAIVTDNDQIECHRINPCDNGAILSKVITGKPWPFTTHQFRRTFAVFTIRNNLGHPIAIKQQFKHLCLRMSEWYGNGAVLARVEDALLDSELQKLIDQSRVEQITTEYDQWHNGEGKLSGGYGKSILAMRDDKPLIYSSWQTLHRLVKDGRLTLHGTLHSYCKNAYLCDMDGLINPAFCSDCSNSIIDEEKALWWRKRHQDMTTYLSQQENVSVGEYSHFIIQIRAAENVMRDFNLIFDMYQHPIKVIDL